MCTCFMLIFLEVQGKISIWPRLKLCWFFQSGQPQPRFMLVRTTLIYTDFSVGPTPTQPDLCWFSHRANPDLCWFSGQAFWPGWVRSNLSIRSSLKNPKIPPPDPNTQRAPTTILGRHQLISQWRAISQASAESAGPVYNGTLCHFAFRS